MGCTQSTTAGASVVTNTTNSPSKKANTGVQDDARSFRSKLGAIKMLTKNKRSCKALKEYLTTQNKAELLICYLDLEEIRQLTDEQALTRASALVWRYKTQFEAIRNQDNNHKPKSLEIVLWECLGRLRYVDGGSIEPDHLLKMINNAQNDLLAKLILPFEGFLHSKQYKAWQDAQVVEEKSRQNKPNNGPASIIGSVSISSRSESFSVAYSNVLIVDDSLVTLKLTRLTLEKDGHTVDKAANGQIALEMLKQRLYDVVLIDLNMPVMDGFETIRLFREYEQSQLQSSPPRRASSRGAQHLRNAGAGAEASKTNEDGNVSDLSDDEALTADEVTQNSTSFSAAGGRPGRYTSSLSVDNSVRSGVMNRVRNTQVIIGMSTNVDDATRKRALEAGMDFFLPKPFTLQKFTEIIKISIHKNSLRSNAPVMSGGGGGGCGGDESEMEFSVNNAFSPP